MKKEINMLADYMADDTRVSYVEKKKINKTMDFGEFINSQKDPLISAEVSEITKAEFYEMLHISPPVRLCMIDGVQMFCVSEIYDGSYSNQYAKIGNKYYTATVDVYEQDTWIHKRLPNLDRMKDTLETNVNKTREPMKSWQRMKATILNMKQKNKRK